MKRTLVWYGAWVTLVVVLVALPVVVWATRGHTSVTTDPLAPTPTPTPTPSATTVAATGDEPLCANVWQKGKTLPAHYAGCQSSGTLTPVLYLVGPTCQIVYDGRFVAAPGGKVQPLADAAKKAKGSAKKSTTSTSAPSSCPAA